MKTIHYSALYAEWEKKEKRARRRERLCLLKYAVILGISVTLLILSVYGIADIFLKYIR